MGTSLCISKDRKLGASWHLLKLRKSYGYWRTALLHHLGHEFLNFNKPQTTWRASKHAYS